MFDRKKYMKQYNQKYRQINKDKIKLGKKKYYQNNKDKIKEERKEYFKEYRFKNREKQNEYSKKYHLEHQEQHKKYYQNNKEKIKDQYKKRQNEIKEYNKKYKQTHPRKCLGYQIKQLKKYAIPFRLNYRKYVYSIQDWSATIKNRDFNSCQVCGSTHRLNAHHIFEKKHYPELSLNESNGVTLLLCLSSSSAWEKVGDFSI